MASAGAQGNFELNAMRPITINDNILPLGQHPWRRLREAPAYSVEGARLDRGKVDEYVGGP